MNGSIKTGSRLSKTTIDIILLSAIAAFFAIVLVQSMALSQTAAMVPKLMSGVGLVLCLIQIAADVKKRNAEKRCEGTEQVKPIQLRWYYLLTIMIIYMISLFLIGFIPTVFLFLIITPFIMKQKKLTVNLILAVVATIVLYFAFVQIFYVRLPQGVLVDYLLDYLF